jgi:Ca2+-binding EF-hand superfamily protein
LGKLCKQTEGKSIPFDKIQAALEAVKPVKKGELSKEEFIKVISEIR